MSDEPLPDTNGHPSHKRGPSWHSLTSPRDSIGSGHRSPATFATHDVDLDDAFDDGDDLSPPDFVLATNALKRESLGEDMVVEYSLEDEGGIGNGMQDHGIIIRTEPMIEVSLDDDDNDPSPAGVGGLHSVPRIRYDDEHFAPASPSTPSIVISRPASPTDDDERQTQFVQVSLSADAKKDGSPRAPVPRRIYVPPPPGIASGVQAVQGPPTPISPHPGTRSPLSSRASPQPTDSSRKASLTSVASPASPSGVQSPVLATPITGRPRRATGISTQDVVSKTRPTHLPPKTREEDLKHMKVWEDMMQKSRLADEQRKHKIIERRLAREQAVEDTLGQWEREVLPDWKAAVRDPRLRQLWWKGVPTKLRGKIWYLTLGNALALSKDAYKSCLSRAKRAISSNAFPADSMHQIEEDIRATLPALHLFHPETGPMYQDLKDLLCAWLVSRADEGLSYVRGASTVGAMFLINMPPDQAFVAMRNMLERHCMRSFYGGTGASDDVEAYYRIFDTLLADVMPKVYFNFKQHGISPALYLPDWFITIFLHHLPFEACSRIWDVLILEGDSFLFRTSIAILGVIESRLFFPDRKELLEVIYGENKAALEVARRSESAVVDLGARYEQYGMTEEALWERLEQTEWKDSTWGRLLQREIS